MSTFPQPRPLGAVDPPTPEPDAIERWTTDGSKIFRTAWSRRLVRYAGVSAFKHQTVYARGGAAALVALLEPFEQAGTFNLLRVWPYVTWSVATNGLEGWADLDPSRWLAFLAFVRARGWMVECTVWTGDEPEFLEPGFHLAEGLARATPDNLVIEGSNENGVNGKRISVPAQQRVAELCAAATIPFAGATWDEIPKRFGAYLCHHESRDFEWVRKIGKDLEEFYRGGGPSSLQDPAYKCPALADEPIKPGQALALWQRELAGQYDKHPEPALTRWRETRRRLKKGGDPAALTIADYYTGAANCGLLGGGGTFHYDHGRTGELPTTFELDCARAFARGLRAFPLDAPLGQYDRIDERGNTLRTYLSGNYMIRIRPLTLEAPEPGWRPLDELGICWERAA